MIWFPNSIERQQQYTTVVVNTVGEVAAHLLSILGHSTDNRRICLTYCRQFDINTHAI